MTFVRRDRSPPRNCSHEALPFVKAPAKAKLAGSIETQPGGYLAAFSAFRIGDVPIMTARNKDVRCDGFENIVLEEGRNEFDFGFVGVAGIERLPDGFYRTHYVINLENPEDAVVSLINSRGETFTYALEVADDPHADRGASQRPNH